MKLDTLKSSTYLHVPEHGLLFPGYGALIPGDVAGYIDGESVPSIAGGAWSVSGMPLLNWIDILDASQLAVDLSLTTHKWAMYDNSNTPNFSTDAGYSATNEVSGTGYTATGRTIAAGGGSPTVTESPTGTLMYDQADMVWTAPTTVTAYGAKLYADALGGDNIIVECYFGGAVTSTAGTFTIQFASGGVLTLDLTP